MGDLSANFSHWEFKCRCHRWWCSGKRKPSKQLISKLEKLRRVTGALYINSGNRCAAHNRSLPNSAKYSKHVKRQAADVRSARLSAKQVADIAERLFPNAGGIGRYSSFTHIDSDGGYRRRWGRN